MAVNAIEVLYLTAGLFKAVPSKTVLTDLAKATNLDTLAKDLGNTPYAINAFPVTSNAEKAKVLAENLLGSSVTDKTAAVTALEGVLNANGGNVGVAALIAIKEILKGGTYADAKAQLENRVKVAEAYVNSPRGTEISTSILNEVTKDAATATAAIEKLNSNNTPGGDYAGTPNDDTVSLLGGLASTIKIEGGQQGAAGDTLVITAQASATANVINLQNFTDQNQTLDAQQRKVSPIIQGFENVDATASTTEMNITGRDRTSELNTGSVASTQTGSVLKGGAYRDTVTGAAGADSIEGNAGNDVLSGGAGNDTIKGGADNDNITGGTGNDTIEDGTGNDTVSGGADNDTITIGGGVDLINGDEGNDTISFAADAVAGTSATVRTTVNGGAGNDTIDNTNATAASFLQVSGGANNDKITLGVATENINAGANNDIIVIKQAALDQVGTVAAGDLDVLNGNDGQDALQLLLTSGDATTTFRLTPVTGQYSGFEVIELIDESGNTNAKTYKIDLTDDFVANNFVNGQFLIDARGLPAGSNLVIDTSALTAASAARFTAGAFQVWTSPSTDIRDQLNKTIDANYAINASNAALNATRAFYTNSSDTTNKAGVHDATTGLITTTPAGATAYTVTGGTAEGATGGSSTGNTFTLTANSAVVTPSANVSTTDSAANPTKGTTAGNDTIHANTFTGAFVQDSSTADNDVFNIIVNGAQNPTLVNIETVNATLAGGNSLTVDNMTNTTRINVNGANGTIITANNSIPTTTSIGFDAGYAGTLTYQAALAGAGTGDVLNLVLNGSATGATLALASSGSGDDDLETLNVNVASNSALTLSSAVATDDFINVAITGAGVLTLAAVDAAVVTGSISAAGSTGSLSATVGGTNAALTGSNQADTFTMSAAAGGNRTINAGSGDDVFDFATFAAHATRDIFNGGAGTDTIKLASNAVHNVAATTNMEAITIVKGATAGATSVQLGAAGTNSLVTEIGGTLTVNASALTATGETFAIGFGAVTAGSVGTANMYKLNITGGGMADILNGGNMNDTIVGGAGADQIAGGLGADTINVGLSTTDNDTVLMTATGQTGTVTSLAGAINVAAADIISGMGAGDLLTLGTAFSYTTAATTDNTNATLDTDVSTSALVANGVTLLRGDYNAAAGTFTANGSGTSSLLVYDADQASTATSYEAVVLVGYTGSSVTVAEVGTTDVFSLTLG